MNRNEKVANFIKEQAAMFFGRNQNNTSLITVTGADCSPDIKHGTVYITVLPTSKEEEALNFCKRNLGELREYIKEHMETKIVPFLEIKIDLGEKNRQRIDELLR